MTIETLTKKLTDTFPNSNVINLSTSINNSNRINRHVRNILKFTENKKNIVLIEILDLNKVYKVIKEYTNTLESLQPPKSVIENVWVILVSDGRLVLIQHDAKNNIDRNLHDLDKSLKPLPDVCPLCCEQIKMNETSACFNCREAMCQQCLLTHFEKGNGGWCPWCRHHMFYHQLVNPSDMSTERKEVLNALLYSRFIFDSETLSPALHKPSPMLDPGLVMGLIEYGFDDLLRDIN